MRTRTSGMPAPERGHCGCEQRALGARERGDVDVAGHVGRGGRELGGRRLELGEDRLGAGDEPAAGLGQPDAAAVAVEQRDAGLALERGELLGDRRGRERERSRGGRDRPALGDLAQHAHAADVERARGGHRKRSLRLSVEIVTCACDVRLAPWWRAAPSRPRPRRDRAALGLGVRGDPRGARALQRRAPVRPAAARRHAGAVRDRRRARGAAAGAARPARDRGGRVRRHDRLPAAAQLGRAHRAGRDGEPAGQPLARVHRDRREPLARRGHDAPALDRRGRRLRRRDADRARRQRRAVARAGRAARARRGGRAGRVLPRPEAAAAPLRQPRADHLGDGARRADGAAVRARAARGDRVRAARGAARRRLPRRRRQRDRVRHLGLRVRARRRLRRGGDALRGPGRRVQRRLALARRAPGGAGSGRRARSRWRGSLWWRAVGAGERRASRRRVRDAAALREARLRLDVGIRRKSQRSNAAPIRAPPQSRR